MLIALTVQLAGVRDDVFEIASRQPAVTVVAVVLLDIEVDRAVRLIGVTRLQYALDECYLLDDMPRGMRLDRGRQHAQLAHSVVVALGVVVCDLHRFELLQTRLLGYLVLALIGIVFEVAYVGDIPHVAHLIAQRAQIAEHHVECHGRARMSQMRVAVDRRAADIHAYIGRGDRFEGLLASCQRIV